MKAIEKLIMLFEDFIKRAVMPSISFVFIFFIFFIGIKSLNQNKVEFISEFLSTIKFDNLNITFLVITLIGLSYLLSILQQLIFDNNIKKNYEGRLFTTENQQLIILRESTIKKLNNGSNEDYQNIKDLDYNDYFLYQAIGRKLCYLKKQTDTSRYVNDTKSIGIFFTSFSLVNLIFSVLVFNLCSFGFVIISILSIIIGFDAIKAKYRSRAIRIYINYLIGENTNNESTMEKIVTIKIPDGIKLIKEE